MTRGRAGRAPGRHARRASGAHPSSVADTVIVTLPRMAFEIGQPLSAASACPWNAAWSSPGTLPRYGSTTTFSASPERASRKASSTAESGRRWDTIASPSMAPEASRARASRVSSGPAE